MKDELFLLKNVGQATYADLMKLKIHSLEELAQKDPDELYLSLQKITGQEHDPCTWDVFAAIIHEAKTGIKTNWWEWSKIRKFRQAKGKFINNKAFGR